MVLHHPNRRALLHGNKPAPWWAPYYLGGYPNGAAPLIFADFTSEGLTNHYFMSGNSYGSFSALLTALSGTVSRASSGYYINSSVVLTSASSNVLRFDHDASGNPLGILLEGASTNNFTYSNAFSTSPWYIINEGSISQNAADPSGNASSAWTFTAGNGFSRIYRPTDTTAVSENISVYVKPGTLTYAYIWCVESAGGQVGTWFNLSTLAMGTNNVAIAGSPVGSFSDVSIKQAANGFIRISAYYNYVSGTYAAGFGFSDANASISATTGNTAVAAFSQSETLNFASSYIPTTSSTASRSADSLTFPWTATTFTARFKGTLLGEQDGNGLLDAGSGLLTQAAGPLAQTSNGTNTLTTPVNAWASQNIVVVGGSSSGRVLSANGNAAASDALALVPSAPTTFYVGALSGGSSSNGHIAQIGLWNVAATATQAATNSATP